MNVQNTQRLLLIVFVVQILGGIAVIGLAQFCSAQLLRHLSGSEASVMRLALAVMLPVQIFGLHVVVHYAFALPLVWRKHSINSSDDVAAARLWHGMMLIVTLDGLLVGWLWYRSAAAIVAQMAATLRLARSQYYWDKRWQHLLDEYQLQEACCGVMGFEDWQRVEWTNAADTNVVGG